jgi:mannose-6-phosphate isomerase-like protein (cupin superfamily)
MHTDFSSNLDQEFAQVSALWSPGVIAKANGQYGKIARVKGEFVGHSHANEDEFFLVRKGTLVIRYRDRADAVLAEGDSHVVPRGVEHQTVAPEECWVVLVEPATTRDSGETESDLTTSIEQQLAHLRPANQQTREQETPARWPSRS